MIDFTSFYLMFCSLLHPQSMEGNSRRREMGRGRTKEKREEKEKGEEEK